MKIRQPNRRAVSANRPSRLAGRLTDWLIQRAARAYFQFAYALLRSASGRSLLRLAAPGGGAVVHGYATSQDLEALIETLRPSAHDLVLDLGSGVGEVAVAVHRRTSCRVVGIDISSRAVSEARRRARAAGVEHSVRFIAGDLARPPLGGSSAFALDSLMFGRQPAHVLGQVSRRLDEPGRIFATFIDHRALGREELARRLRDAGLRVEQLEDVTVELRARSRERAQAARSLRARRPRDRRSRLTLWLVIAEESLMGRLLDNGRARRWRLAVTRADPSSAEGR